MRILVAGGAGFVGSHLVDALVDRGDEVTVIDNLSSGSVTNLNRLTDSPLFAFEERDVAWDEGLEMIGDGGPWDVIVHLASPASPTHYEREPILTLAANSIGTFNLLDLASVDRARFVLASTSEVYGDPLVHPQPETYWGNVDPIGPRSQYDEGKRFSEALVTAYRRRLDVRAAIVRIFNTYGPRMRLDDGRVIPAYLSAALAGQPLPVHASGAQTRSFMYVDDLVAALTLVIDDDQSDGLVVNVGNPVETSMFWLAELVNAVTGLNSPIDLVAGREGDPRQRCPDISLMRARYGWAPRVALVDGLRRTWEWAREQ